MLRRFWTDGEKARVIPVTTSNEPRRVEASP